MEGGEGRGEGRAPNSAEQEGLGNHGNQAWGFLSSPELYTYCLAMEVEGDIRGGETHLILLHQHNFRFLLAEINLCDF